MAGSNEHAFQQLVNQVQLLSAQLQQTQQALATHQQQAAMVPVPAAAPPRPSSKINRPTPFEGCDRRSARIFLTKCRLEFEASPQLYTSDAPKVRFAASYLVGTAFDWIAPHLDTFNTNEPSSVIASWDSFCSEFLRSFGEPDEVRHAVHSLAQLRQTTSVSAYATEFQIHAARTAWNDAAKRDRFYEGL
jgi:hypothetical protein